MARPALALSAAGNDPPAAAVYTGPAEGPRFNIGPRRDSDHHIQRDLFPMPLIPKFSTTTAGASHSIKRRLVVKRRRQAAANDAIGALNEMMGMQTLCGEPSAGQLAAQRAVLSQLEDSHLPSGMYTNRGAD